MSCFETFGNEVNIYYPEKYIDKEKNVGIFVHTLEAGGSQMAVQSLIKRFIGKNYNVWVISTIDGLYKDIYTRKDNAVVILQNEKVISKEYRSTLQSFFDLVILNSICSLDYSIYFINKEVPVFWWIHEAKEAMNSAIEYIYPLKLISDNYKFLSAWPKCSEDFQSVFGLKSIMMNIEVEDSYIDVGSNTHNDIVNFLIPGSYSSIKGFHIALQAIALLPEEYIHRSRFTFVGYVHEMDYFNVISEFASKFSNVTVVKECSRDEMNDYYQQSDCVIVPSLFDAGPLTVVEALMHKRLCITTYECGVSAYLHDCVDSFVYPAENIQELYKRILLVISDHDKLSEIVISGRRVYENNFSISAVDAQFEKIFGDIV